MKVKAQILGSTGTVPRQVKVYGKEGAIEAVAVANGRQHVGIVVDGETRFYPGGKVTTVEAGLEKHAAVGVDDAGPPSPYRGSWRVAFGLTQGRPLLELRRKTAAYAAVLVTWDGVVWTWEVTREERWFAKGRKSDKGTADSMERAIHTAVASLDKHVRDACVVQHLEKRTAHDAGWAATHPERPERVPKPVPGIGEPKKPKASKAAKRLPTSSPVPGPSKPRKPRGTVIPARTEADRGMDRRYGPLEVTPLYDSPGAPAAGADDADKDAALMRMFAAAVDQAMSGVT